LVLEDGSLVLNWGSSVRLVVLAINNVGTEAGGEILWERGWVGEAVAVFVSGDKGVGWLFSLVFFVDLLRDFPFDVVHHPWVKILHGRVVKREDVRLDLNFADLATNFLVVIGGKEFVFTGLGERQSPFDLLDTVDLNQFFLSHLRVDKRGAFLVIGSEELELVKLVGVINDITLLVFTLSDEGDLRSSSEDVAVFIGIDVDTGKGLHGVEFTWDDLNLVGFSCAFAAVWNDD
jgi:hypothetical protein